MKLTNLLRRSVIAALGLVVFSFGVYLTLQAHIGVAPWDVFAQGLSHVSGFGPLPLSYGDAVLLIGIVFLGIDVLLREHIGIGSVLDALIVGKTTDLFLWLKIVPEMPHWYFGVPLMIAGLFVMAVGVRIYMAVGLCCGPRDSFFIAIGKRLRRLSVGAVELIIQGSVLLIGWLMGGQVGIGTLIAVVVTGYAMEIVFRLTRFEPRDVRHLGFIEMLRLMKNKKETDPSCHET